MAGKGLGNPAALIAVSETGKALAPAAGKAVDKGVDFLDRNAKPILVFSLIAAGLYFGPKWYKKWRAEKYANENIGNPNLTAAAIIYSSIKRLEPQGLLSWLVPEINYWTNENALNQIAADPRINIKSVANAYKIMYDRNLASDVQNGLSTNELNEWYGILNSQGGNEQTTLYPIGSKLYVAKPSIVVNKAIKKNGIWEGTNTLFGRFNFNEKVGTVVANGFHQGENYYIVEDCNFIGLGCETGVVLQNQVIDVKR